MQTRRGRVETGVDRDPTGHGFGQGAEVGGRGDEAAGLQVGEQVGHVDHLGRSRNGARGSGEPSCGAT